VFDDLLATFADARPGSVIPYTAYVEVQVVAPFVGRIRVPLEMEGELPIPEVPDVSISAIHWNEVGLRRLEAIFVVRVENLNEFEVDLQNFSYRLSVGGRSVAGGDVDRIVMLEGGEAGEIHVPVVLSTTNLGRGGIGAVFGDRSLYRLEGKMALETAYGPLWVDYSAEGAQLFGD